MRRAARALPELVVMLVIAASLATAAQFFRVVRVQGGSMRPTLEAGDLIVLETRRVPTTGDIVLYHTARSDGATLHRLVCERDDGWVAQGDANPIPDRELVPTGCISGIVRWYVPLGAALQRAAGVARGMGIGV